jgi:hypothetical protein
VDGLKWAKWKQCRFRCFITKVINKRGFFVRLGPGFQEEIPASSGGQHEIYVQIWISSPLSSM